MAIEDRNLRAGTQLRAKYKQRDYTCEVAKTKDGLRFVLDDGKAFKSPSSAGSAVMGGGACNGWRFWSVAEAETKTPTKALAKRKSKAKAKPMPEHTEPNPAEAEPVAENARKGNDED